MFTMRRLNLLSFLVIVQSCLLAHTHLLQAGCVGDICAELPCLSSPLTLELGECLPVGSGYGNASSSDVTFTVTMNTNKFFGPEHVIYTHEQPANTGVHWTANKVVCSTYSMPIGTDTVIITVTSSTTGPSVIAQCSYQLTLTLPAKLMDLIQVPVRWCAIENTKEAEGKKPGELASGKNLLSQLQRASDEYWTKDAHIALRSAMGTGVPVVKDPDPDTTNFFQKGDINAGNIFDPGYEAEIAVTECEQAWAKLAPGQKGIILLNTGKIIGRVPLLGFTPAAKKELQINGTRQNDLCWYPRKLTVSDITGQYVAVVDKSFSGTPWYSSFSFPYMLSHEIGHALLLGHGNGLDDNHDGKEPPTPGSRRYDAYCDPLGIDDKDFPLEDQGTTESSLMDYNETDGTITPLQIEQARAAAKIVPGAVFDKAADPTGTLVADFSCGSPPCGLSPDIFIIKAEIAETPDIQSTGFNLTVLGPIPPEANNEYLMFADLDNNPSTGCSPSDLGFPTNFQGAELVTSVFLDMLGGVQVVMPTVWQCQGGSLVQVNDPGIRASAFNQTAESIPLFGIVSIEMPDTVRGPAGTQVRMQALAQQLNLTGQLDRLPDDPDEGGVISLLPPVFPQCTLTPPVVSPGGATTIDASGLLPNQTAEVYVGDQLIGTGPINGSGNVHFSVTIPSTSREGVRPVAVVVQGTVVNASSAVLVEGTPLTPATIATLVPLPNGAGWNNSDVTVTLTAVDYSGSGIKEITYSATGAQPIGTKTAAGATATVLISKEGETTISYFATDNSGTNEASQNITVRLDKTQPSISGSSSPAPNLPGWNNTDVMVSFNCQDSMSGISFCTGTTTLTTDGVNQSVTGTATDYAFNTASTTVSGINIDMTPPVMAIVTPFANAALQDGVTFQAKATDNISGVDKVFFSVREPDGGEGTPIGYEDLAATFNTVTGYWEYPFNTTVLQDGYYVILAKAIDNAGNEGWSAVVPFSIRNWAVIKLLPSTPNNKAGRTMPVKFSLRIAASVDPAMPFVYNEDLEIKIYRCNNTSCSSKTLIQTSTYGTGTTDYRINGELYITNFKTAKTPAQYLVEIWRPTKNFMVGSFSFKTVK